jgi:tetratricopeptide (TPR) repeat protein
LKPLDPLGPLSLDPSSEVGSVSGLSSMVPWLGRGSVDTLEKHGLSSGEPGIPSRAAASIIIIKDHRVGQALEARIRKLQDLCWSAADPDGRCFVHLADAYRRAGDLLEARRVLRDGTDRHPDFVSGHVVSAWVSLDQGHPDQAAESYRAVLALDPRNIAALRGLAGILEQEGEVEPALELLEELLEEDSTDVGLPARIEDLKDRLVAVVQGKSPEEGESESLLRSAWGDLEEMAEALDWGSAALQEDLSPEGEDLSEEWTEMDVEAEAEVEAEAGVEAETGVEAEAKTREIPEDDGEEPLEPWVAEDGVPAPGLKGKRDSLVTSTLGEIYLRQGYLEWAEEVFLSLLDRDPGSADLLERVEKIRALRRERERVKRSEAESDPTEAGVSVEVPVPAIILTIDDLAPDPIVSIEDLAPGTILPIEDLAPGTILPIEDLAPGTILPIEDLAPDTILPAEDLAPGTIFSIPDLSPEVVVSIESLAPDGIVPVEALAPDPPAVKGRDGHDKEEEVRTGDRRALDAFQAWLDSLP